MQIMEFNVPHSYTVNDINHRSREFLACAMSLLQQHIIYSCAEAETCDTTQEAVIAEWDRMLSKLFNGELQ